MDRKAKIKVIVAVVALAAGIALLAWNFWPKTSGPVNQPAAVQSTELTTKQKDGTTVVRSGGRSQVVQPEKKSK